MDQVKIGKFIANVRKGKGMTQKQLADEIGVSDKTVSKWETGNGMPELSSVMPLCQILQINVNELLSGEHLSDDSYSQKAEENMMNLIHETEKSKKENKNNRFLKIMMLLLNLLAVVIVVLTTWVLMGNFHITPAYLLDFPTLFNILMVAVLSLSITGQWKHFFQAFGIVFGKKKEHTQAEVASAGIAVKLASNTMLVTGALNTIFSLILICYFLEPNAHSALLEVSVAVAISLLGIFYGCILCLLLLPLKSKLALIGRELEGSQG